MKAKDNFYQTDEELALQAQIGNQKAIGELYSKYYLLVFNKCLSFTKYTEDAHDLTQDVMIRALERIDSFKSKSKFSTWLYAITFNYCTDFYRKSKNKHFETLDIHFELIDESNSAYESAVEKNTKAETAEKALSEIDEDDLELLLMKYQLNKSINDIQSIYNLSASAVKMRLSRAKSKVQLIYKSHLETAA